MEKAALRERFKLLAKNFLATHNQAALEKIHAHIANRLAEYVQTHLPPAQCLNPKIAIYKPMKVELPVKEIVSHSSAFTAPAFLYPHLDGDRMWFIDEVGGITEPDIIIVPGLFIDQAGNRLGRGKGYYDRYLAQSKVPEACRIFLGYDFQFIEFVPTAAHDLPVSRIALRA